MCRKCILITLATNHTCNCEFFCSWGMHDCLMKGSFKVIGASLSKPHTSVTSLHPCLCMLVCMLGPTAYSESLPALILCVLRYSLIQKGLEDSKDVNLEQSTSFSPWWWQQGQRLLVDLPIQCLSDRGNRMAICRCHCLCCLTHGSCHWTQISSGYSNGGYR